jgi:hypothetical protein
VQSYAPALDSRGGRGSRVNVLNASFFYGSAAVCLV